MDKVTAIEVARNVAQNLRPCDVSAYLDTVEIWLPLLRIEQYRDVARLGRVEECRTRHGRLVGCRVIRNQPSKAVLHQLDRLARQHRGVLHRVDVALDSEARTGLRDRIVSTARLKWSRKGQMHEIERTVYWVYRARSRRNLVLYDDKSDRRTGELDCIHFELRLIGADVIKRQGFRSVRDLLALNPRRLFEKHVTWSDAGESHVKKGMRRENNRYRSKYAGKAVSKVMDAFLAYVPRHVRHVYTRLGLDRAQNVKHGERNRVDAVLNVPARMEWNARPVGMQRAKMPPLKSLRNPQKMGVDWCLSPQRVRL